METSFDYLLYLDFENAGVFKKYWKEDSKNSGSLLSRNKEDRILENRARNIRSKNEWIDNDVGTIHYSFITQVLRSLCGLRPYPKYRKSALADNGIIDSSIEDSAKSSYVKINNLIVNNSYAYEKQTVIKALDNSWETVNPTLLRIKYALGERGSDVFNKIDSLYSKIDGTFGQKIETILKLSETNQDIKNSFDDIIQDCESLNRKLVSTLLCGGANSLQQDSYQGYGVFLKSLVKKGVTSISRLDGSIIIPANQVYLDKINYGNGLASLFDGGIVTIKNIENRKNINFEHEIIGYKKVQL